MVQSFHRIKRWECQVDPISSQELAAFSAAIGQQEHQPHTGLLPVPQAIVSSVDEIAERAAKKLLADYRADITEVFGDSHAERRIVTLMQIAYRMSLSLQQTGPGMLKAAHSNALAFAAIIESRF
jgi:hypothetical protein